jgi:hypothetical protein
MINRVYLPTTHSLRQVFQCMPPSKWILVDNKGIPNQKTTVIGNVTLLSVGVAVSVSFVPRLWAVAVLLGCVLNQYALSDGCELVLHIYLFYSSHEDDSDTQSEVDTADLRSNITSLLEKITVTLSRDHMLACRSESGCEVPINIDEECEPYGMELKEQISAGTSSNQSTEYTHLLIFISWSRCPLVQSYQVAPEEVK